MIEKNDLRQELQGLLEIEEEVLSLCARQLSNAAFFSGISPQNRPDVRAALEAFLARSQQQRQALLHLMADIESRGQNVY